MESPLMRRLREARARQVNAHIIAFWQNKYGRGCYKPMAREFREGRK